MQETREIVGWHDFGSNIKKSQAEASNLGRGRNNRLSSVTS